MWLLAGPIKCNWPSVTLWSVFQYPVTYVKAPLRVIYGKYSTRGGVEWQIQHEAKPSAVFARDPTPSTVFFCTSRVNGTLTDLLFCVGRISSISSDGFERMCISK